MPRYDFAKEPFRSPQSPKFERYHRAEMKEFGVAERRSDKGSERDCI
jgi:hypothetical protein